MRRRESGIGCGARGRGMNAPPKPPGGAGAPPGDTTVPCQELADGGPPGLPEARNPRPPTRGPLAKPEARRHGQPKSAARRRNENAAMARREAPAFPKGCAASKDNGRAAWRAISLDSFGGGEGNTGVPGAAKNTGDDACARCSVGDSSWLGRNARCADPVFLAISSRFPVGVKRPYKAAILDAPGTGGSVSPASHSKSRMMPP
jgi:hypothetical protein